MLVIENCNSLSDLRQKLIDGEEVRTARHESCGDAIGREDALMCLTGEIKETDTIETIIARFERRIRKLPSVNPQPKTGHWKAKSFHELFCDNCGFDFDIMRNDFIDKMNYCPNCGAKMVEPKERSCEG